MRRSRLPSSAANTAETTNVSSFYKSLILGYFSLGMRIGRCELHKRAQDVRTAVHRRADHKYLCVHRHRLLSAQCIVTDGQKRCLRKLAARFRATWCLFMVYSEDVVSNLLRNVASDLVNNTLPSALSAITRDSASCLQHEGYQMTSTRAHQTGSFLFKARHFYFGYIGACCTGERLA